MNTAKFLICVGVVCLCKDMHKADIGLCAAMSAIGVKRTCPFALQMSLLTRSGHLAIAWSQDLLNCARGEGDLQRRGARGRR